MAFLTSTERLILIILCITVVTIKAAPLIRSEGEETCESVEYKTNDTSENTSKDTSENTFKDTLDTPSKADNSDDLSLAMKPVTCFYSNSTSNSFNPDAFICRCDPGFIRVSNDTEGCIKCENTNCKDTTIPSDNSQSNNTLPPPNVTAGSVIDDDTSADDDIIKAVETSSSVSYFGGVLTMVLVVLGYSKRGRLRECMLGGGRCQLAVRTEGVTVMFSEVSLSGCQVVDEEKGGEDVRMFSEVSLSGGQVVDEEKGGEDVRCLEDEDMKSYGRSFCSDEWSENYVSSRDETAVLQVDDIDK